MRYVFRWNTRRFGPVFLKSLDNYEQGEQQSKAFTPDVGEALQFDTVQDAMGALQERALNINDTNHKLELVTVETDVRVGAAL